MSRRTELGELGRGRCWLLDQDCYDAFGGGDFKLGRIELTGSVRLSGDTPGERLKSPFHRVSMPAMARADQLTQSQTG
jgi:hypothetical protein